MINQENLSKIVKTPKLSLDAKGLYLAIFLSPRHTYINGFLGMTKQFHETEYKVNQEIKQLKHERLIKQYNNFDNEEHGKAYYHAYPVSESRL